MDRNMFFDSGIYKLEELPHKIDKIVNSSTPIAINDVFSEKAFADVPTGTYYFYINDYELDLDWLIGNVFNLFELLDRITKEFGKFLMTINYENCASYLVANVLNNNVRLTFLDRDDINCRTYETRFNDTKLEHTIAVCDILINKFELIKQFNNTFKTIYETNKYYISDEYAELCKKNGAIICQEKLLLTMKEYIKIFDKYLQHDRK